MVNCPACGGTRLRATAPSRARGRIVTRCQDCRAAFLPVERSTTPPEPVPLDEISAEDYRDWVGIKRESAGPAVWREALGWIRSTLGDLGRSPRLYDVGAGDGQFLQIGRDEFGFEVTGNDIVEGAVVLAKQSYDVDLDLGDLGSLGHREEFDAVTLWCVLAHVPDGEAMLSEVAKALRPGGVVHLQTPHRTWADTAALAVQHASGGRLATLPDRRLAEHHRILHTPQSITRQLERFGFTDVRVEPQLRYTLTSEAYLASLNPPSWSLKPGSWLMDRAISSKVAPRIVLDVRARRA